MRDTLCGMSGWVELFEVVDGVWRPVGCQKNLITRQGADIMARSLVGLGKLNCVYFAYSNQVGSVEISASEDNTAATYKATAEGRGVGRSLAVSSASISSSDSGLFAGNKITLTAITSGEKLSGLDMVDNVSSVNHIALVSAASESDAAADLVFSCADLVSERVKTAGAQIGVRWTITCVN